MLKLNNVSKTFNPGTVNEKTALSGLTLDVHDGDFITIIGANGAGKSTLFNAIAGSFYTDSGNIELAGRDITFMPEHKRARMIGRLFQDPMRGSAPGMSIGENLAMAAKSGGWFSHISKSDRAMFREKLALLDMGLEDRLTQPVGLLSGGQRQALTLLMATIVTPKLLLLDEHTAALDPNTAAQVMKLTDQIIHENQITTLMITHNLRQALEYGTKTLIMNEGKIVRVLEGEEKKQTSVEELLQMYDFV